MGIKKQDWIDAGNVDGFISFVDLEAALGRKVPQKIKNLQEGWEATCKWAYKVITGEELTCAMQGRGSRSRYFGEQVAEVWPEPDADGNYTWPETEQDWKTAQQKLGCPGCFYADPKKLFKGPCCTFAGKLNIISDYTGPGAPRGDCLTRKPAEEERAA